MKLVFWLAIVKLKNVTHWLWMQCRSFWANKIFFFYPNQLSWADVLKTNKTEPRFFFHSGRFCIWASFCGSIIKHFIADWCAKSFENLSFKILSAISVPLQTSGKLSSSIATGIVGLTQIETFHCDLHCIAIWIALRLA